MAWLIQNWIFIVAIVAVFLLMSRGGGCGGGHHRHSDQGNDMDPTADHGQRSP